MSEPLPIRHWTAFRTCPSSPANSFGNFSYLPGQRLSRCTCPDEEHPGPMHDDGTLADRSAPEIDVFEATAHEHKGAVSQSGQWAPFNAGYEWFNTTANFIVPDTGLNTGGVSFLFSVSRIQEVGLSDLCYLFSVFQQAISSVSITSKSSGKPFHFRLNADDGIDFRRRLLRAQH